LTEEHLDRFDIEVEVDLRKEIRAKYSELFRSELGRQVLTDILRNCEFGSFLHPDNSVRFVWHNVAVTILKEAGMMGSDVMDQVVNALCNVYPEEMTK